MIPDAKTWPRSAGFAEELADILLWLYAVDHRVCVEAAVPVVAPKTVHEALNYQRDGVAWESYGRKLYEDASLVAECLGFNHLWFSWTSEPDRGALIKLVTSTTRAADASYLLKHAEFLNRLRNRRRHLVGTMSVARHEKQSA